ncbi:MAG TPA: protein kinase [Polyangiaceae bacterium]|nr:protein kinase [Polyangiaceae bacterium]
MNTAMDAATLSDSGIVSPGHVLGRYELLMPIAAGGMAMVWAARLKGTRGFQKIVAVKTMLPKLSEDIQFEQMFLDEASLASQIRHPYVVEILDLGEQDGVLFLVMEWIDGMPLNQLMKAAKLAGGMPLPIAVRIVAQATAGLHAAHELRDGKGQLVGLVHRDVSPQNILVTYDGVTKVVDFGVAKATAMGGGATAAGQIKGKVGYMAPEQIEGESIDRRADVFAIGIVLYALTTGKHPFRRESDAATMYNICSPQPVLPPSKFIPDFPEALERTLLRALAKSANERHESANELLRDLDQALPQEQRATDEDVAIFVRKLVGDRLEERRNTLTQALARADQHALNTPTGTRETRSLPTAVELPPITVLPGSATDLAYSPAPRKKRRVAATIGLTVLVASLGALAATLLRTPMTPPARELSAQPRETQTLQPALPVLPPEAPLPAAVGTSATSASAAAPAASNVKPPGASRQRGTAAPAPAPKPPLKKPNWKHDPGF